MCVLGCFGRGPSNHQPVAKGKSPRNSRQWLVRRPWFGHAPSALGLRRSNQGTGLIWVKGAQDAPPSRTRTRHRSDLHRDTTPTRRRRRGLAYMGGRWPAASCGLHAGILPPKRSYCASGVICRPPGGARSPPPTGASHQPYQPPAHPPTHFGRG